MQDRSQVEGCQSSTPGLLSIKAALLYDTLCLQTMKAIKEGDMFRSGIVPGGHDETRLNGPS